MNQESLPPLLLLDTLRRLRRTSLLLCLFFLRVLRPRAGFPHGVTGPALPIGAFPSPPPCGWSHGFITLPLT